jgi:hypothetical protein
VLATELVAAVAAATAPAVAIDVLDWGGESFEHLG